MTVPERLLVSACQSASVRGGGGPASRASVASWAEPSRASRTPPSVGEEPSGVDPPDPPVPVGEPSGALPPAPLVAMVDEPLPAVVADPLLPPAPVSCLGDSTSTSHALSKAAVAPVVISKKRRRSIRGVDFNIALHSRYDTRRINWQPDVVVESNDTRER